MSIEAALASLQKAVEANTAALATIGKAAGAKAGTTTPPAGDKPKADVKKDTKPKAKTDEEMRNAFGGYLSSGDASGKETRKANLKLILAHYEAGLVTEIAADKREDALADLKTFQEGGTPSWGESAGGDPDEEDMLG